MGAPAPAASAADFTSAAGGSGNWSTGANWEGGVAPSGIVGKLSFPATACAPGCPSNFDDISGLTASTLSIVSPPNTGGQPPRWVLAGASTPLTLTSGLDAGFTQDGSTGSALAEVRIPLVLGAPNVWTVDHGILNLTAVTGLDSNEVSGSHSLAINLTNGGVLRPPQRTEVGPITITGESGGERLELATVAGSTRHLNYDNGGAVALDRVSISGSGELGALATNAAGVVLGSAGEKSAGLNVKSAALDAATTVTIPITGDGTTSGKDHGILSSNAGAIDLASAQLALAPAQCSHLDVGDRYTLVVTNGKLTGTFANAGQYSFLGEPACPGLGYRLGYLVAGQSSVTATVEQAGTAPPPFTWVGESGSWSDASHWSDGVAPGQSVEELVFGCGGACVADNDITDLTTKKLGVTPGMTLRGKSITLGAGGLLVQQGFSFSQSPRGAPVLGLPVVLGTDQTWVLGSDLAVSGGLSGAGLRTGLGSARTLTLSGSNQLGEVNVGGSGSIAPGSGCTGNCGAARSGTLVLSPGASLNTANGNMVTIEEVVLQGAGGSLGGLRVGAGARVQVGDTFGGGAKVPLSVRSAAFDPSASLRLSGEAARLQASESVALGGATLVLAGLLQPGQQERGCLEFAQPSVPDSAATRPPVGTTFTVVSGSVTGTFANAPASGVLIKDVCSRATYRIDYRATGVIATHVAADGAQPSPDEDEVPSPHRDEVKAALAEIGKPGKRSKIGTLLTKGGYTFTFAAPSAGALIVIWKAGKKTVASGKTAATAAGDVKLKVKLTRAGKRKLKKVKKNKQLKLTSTAAFTPTGGTRTSVTTSFKVKR